MVESSKKEETLTVTDVLWGLRRRKYRVEGKSTVRVSPKSTIARLENGARVRLSETFTRLGGGE